MPGSPVLHHLQECAQTQVHGAGAAVQPSHPLSTPSPPAFLFPSVGVFSNDSALHIRWPEHWSFSFGISPSSECSELVFFRINWLDLLAP